MRRTTLFIVLCVWLITSLGFGVFLISGSAASSRHEILAARAYHLAYLLSPSLDDRDALQRELDSAKRLDSRIIYAMVWKPDGVVLAHTHKPAVGQFLDATRWPALSPDEHLRAARLSAPEWADPAVKGNTTDVLEFATPIFVAGKPIAFLSIAYERDGLGDGEYVGYVLLASAAGALLILAGAIVTQRRFERSRREILQTARARTSLLTERGMLASVLAHEIRSPLTALRFNLHALRQLLIANTAEHSDKQTELTDRCEREIRRLDNMLTDFLHHTQVIGGATSECTSLNTAIHEAVEFLRPTLERSSIHVSLHLDAADPRVHVHPDELRQVILNLTANAQDALQNLPAQKARTLAISTIADPSPLPSPDAKPTVTLLIRDSGPGIPADIRERIFEPFFSTKPNGSGLGLTLVRRVISGAGGTILYESSPEQNTPGTTFRITLPRASPQTPPPRP